MAEHDDETDEQTESPADFFSGYAEKNLGMDDDSRPSPSARKVSDRSSDRSARAATKSPARPARAARDDESEDLEDERESDSDEAALELEDVDPDEESEEEDAESTEDDAEEEEGESEEGEDDDEEESEGEDDDLGDDFRAAADRHKLPTDFEQIVTTLPKEQRAAARAAFARELKAVKAGFTRMTQEGREYRQRERVLLADAVFKRDHPVEHILEILQTNPKVATELGQRLSALEDDRGRSVEERHIQNLRRETQDKVSRHMDDVERRQQRGLEVERFAQRLCAHYGIDYELVEDALILAVKESKERDISDDRVREIVKAKATKLKGKLGLRKQAERKQYVREKLADRKRAASPAAKARRGGGAIPAPAKRRDPDVGSDVGLRKALLGTVRRIAPDMARD